MNDGIIKMSPQFASMPRALLGAASPVPTPLPYWPFDANNITTGLVGWWKLDETTGATAFDSSGNGMNGTLGGGLRFSESPGVIGNSLQAMLTASSRFITVANNAAQNFPGDFTLAAWAKTTSLSFSFLKNLSNATDQYEFSMRSGGSFNGLYFRGGGSDISVQSDRSTLLTDGQWHHLCATRRGTALAIYIDGKIAGSGNPTFRSFATNTLNLTLRCNGSMDDARMYNRGLTASEVALLFAYRGRNLYESP